METLCTGGVHNTSIFLNGYFHEYNKFLFIMK